MIQNVKKLLKKNRISKLNYKINFRCSASFVMCNFVSLLCATLKKMISLSNKIINRICKLHSAVRHGRSFLRSESNSSHSSHYRRSFFLS